ncbi:unnamed protein product [Boreogadus saida]
MEGDRHCTLGTELPDRRRAPPAGLLPTAAVGVLREGALAGVPREGARRVYSGGSSWQSGSSGLPPNPRM